MERHAASNEEILIAAVPSREVLQRFAARLNLPAGSQDVYLAYASGIALRFAGYLITERGTIDRVTAFCPIHPDLKVASASWCRDVARQLTIAGRVAASSPNTQRRDLDVIWLDEMGSSDAPTPAWLFAVACVPLTREWDGALAYPRPFSPEFFERMVAHPEAPAWIAKRLREGDDRISPAVSQHTQRVGR
jgi:hypothetical protein